MEQLQKELAWLKKLLIKKKWDMFYAEMIRENSEIAKKTAEDIARLTMQANY